MSGSITSPMSYIFHAGRCLGFVFRRGKMGYEAFDREEASLGLVRSETAAANAVAAAANAQTH